MTIRIGLIPVVVKYRLNRHSGRLGGSSAGHRDSGVTPSFQETIDAVGAYIAGERKRLQEMRKLRG